MQGLNRETKIHPFCISVDKIKFRGKLKHNMYIYNT